MDNLTQTFNLNVVTKFVCFPYSLSFADYFADFDGMNIFNTDGTLYNQKVTDFVETIEAQTRKRIDALKLPVITDIDWRFMPEYTPDGFRVETTQPILKISGVPEDIGKLFLYEDGDMSEQFKFSQAYEEPLQRRALKDEHPRNFLRDLWYVGNGFVKPQEMMLVVRANQSLH